MGKVRERCRMLACGMCGANKYDPCVHRVTGRELKNYHISRVREGKNDVLNAQVARIEARKSARRNRTTFEEELEHDEEWQWIEAWFDSLVCIPDYYGEF